MSLRNLTDEELETANGGQIIRRTTAADEKLKLQVQTVANSVKDFARTQANQPDKSQQMLPMMMLLMSRRNG